MILNYKSFTLGVEEEYMVLDPATQELKSHEQQIVHEGQKVIKDKVKAMGDAEILALLAGNGRLIKRPLVTDGDKSSVGFEEGAFLATWR